MFGLTRAERRVLKPLTTPTKIQDFLDALPMNFEKGRETLRSPRGVLRAHKAHCIEGALLAALALALHGEQPLIMDLMAREPDDHHVLALYRRGLFWGAVSKTNHATIRFRDPVYRTLRELALSYFHEWFMNSNGEKTLESYSLPLNLKRLPKGWATATEDLWYLEDMLDALPHYALVPKKNRRYIRRADRMELAAGRLTEWG